MTPTDRFRYLATVMGLLLAATIAAPATAQQGAPAPTPPAAGEQSLPTFTETLRVEVVNLEVFVSDRRGNPVTGLEAEDFHLLVDGREVPITNFYAEVLGVPRGEAAEERAAGAAAEEHRAEGSGAPPGPPEQRLRLVVAVDHAHLEAANRRRALRAVEDFVEQSLRPEDAVTVASLDRDLVVHADFLNDPATVGRILRDLSDVAARGSLMDVEKRRILSDLSRGQSGGFLGESAVLTIDPNEIMARIRAYAADQFQRSLGTLRLLDRLLSSLTGVPGRKALLLVSDGLADRPGEDLYAAWVRVFGSGNPEAERGTDRFEFSTDYGEQVGHYDLMPQIAELAERANAAGVTFYALDAENDHTSDLRSAQLEQGVASEVLSLAEGNLRAPLERAAGATGGRRVQASGRLDEQLARLAADFESFYSLGFTPPQGTSGEVLPVEVRVDGPWRVRSREQLRPVGDEEQAAAATVASLLFNAGGNPLQVALSAGEPQDREDGNTVLPLRVEIPFDRIGVEPQGDRVAARLSLFVTVLDRDGEPRPVQRLPFHLAVPAEHLDELQGRPAHTVLPVVLRPGDRQVAVGVRDELSGLTSATRLELGGGRGP